MKVEIEGKRLNITQGGLVQMARKKEIHPWFYVKSDELTGGKWVKAGELKLFEGAWGDEEAKASKIRASKKPARRAKTHQTRRPAGAARIRPSARRPTPSRRTVASQRKTPDAATTAHAAFLEVHGFRVDYIVACPSCKGALTKLGFSECPRCGASLAGSKQVYYLKKVLYGVVMAVFAIGTFVLKELAEYTKFIYPVAGVVLAVLSFVGRSAKVLVTVSIKGRALPPKLMQIPLNEYYSHKGWGKLVQRVKATFRLEPLLSKLSEEESPDLGKSGEAALTSMFKKNPWS